MRERRWRERVVSELGKNPAWRVFLGGSTWVCPYCVKPAVENARGNPELADLVLSHLKACPQWQEFKGMTRSAPALQAVVHKTEITNQMRANPAWRLRDPEGKWYCPYCARPTEVVFESNKLDKPTLESIVKHVEQCYAYEGGNGQPQTLEYLQNVLKASQKVKSLIASVSHLVATEPLWQFKNKGQRWACPYCRRIVDSVDVSSPFLTESVAPREIAKHLVTSCSEYKDGNGKLATEEEMAALTSGGGRKSAVVTRPAAPDDSVMFAAIRAELSEVRDAVSKSKEADARQKELLSSLEKAGKQQQMMLPDIPEVPHLEIEVLYRPMATVSGDFYDFIRVSPGEVGIAVGDVSGHGMEAALVMSMVKKSLKIHGRGSSSAAEVLRVANADVHEDLAQSTFCTVFYGVLEVETRTLRFSRAGHSPLVVFNPARGDPGIFPLEPKGLALGIDKGPVFNRTLEEMELKLSPGDMLVQFTDGVIEATNSRKQEFGTERLYDAIRKYGTHEAKYLAHMLELTLQEYRGQTPAEDDVTVMCIKVS
jgi:serine phosphatase RsbU (regulator of sigma subunit)